MCKNQYCWMWFGRKINNVAGFGSESARLVYITSPYRKLAPPPSGAFLGGAARNQAAYFTYAFPFMFLSVGVHIPQKRAERVSWSVACCGGQEYADGREMKTEFLAE